MKGNGAPYKVVGIINSLSNQQEMKIKRNSDIYKKL